MQIEIRALTFGGFYGGRWDQGEDEYREAQCEEALEVIQLKDDWGFGPDYRTEVAKIYAEYYIDMVNEILDVDFKIISQEVDSPKEYNFTNDKIFIQVEVGDYEALIDKLIKLASNPEYRAELGKIIHDEHTSCSGFWSWMSNDIEEWFGLMYNPDNAHYTSYFIAYLMSLMDSEKVENLDESIYWYVSESTGLQVLGPETDEAKEEYNLYLENPQAYAAFVEGPGASEFNGFCPCHAAWELYKDDYMDFLKEYTIEQKRKEAIANYPKIPGLE